MVSGSMRCVPSIRISLTVPPPIWAGGGLRDAVWPVAGGGDTAAAKSNAAIAARNTEVRRMQRKTPPPPSNPAPPGVTAALGYQALYKLDDPQMDEIVPGGEDHQCEHQ